jgi:hypothetical protein
MEMYKDIEIGEHKYRIGRLSAKTGTWILSLAIKDMQGSLSEAEHANIHQHLLSVCSRYKGEHPMPILKADGSLAVKDLEHDLNAVVKLKKEAKDFNFADFFAERAREIKSAMSQDPTSDSTAE